MGERVYSCQECHHVFRLPAADSSTDRDVRCPDCGSTHTRELSAWVPLGADLDEGTSQWEYECQECHHVFKRPVPTSPSQEREIACPACGGRHIHRLTAIGGEPLYCG
jgi:putative FmdB family regulatory protein